MLNYLRCALALYGIHDKRPCAFRVETKTEEKVEEEEEETDDEKSLTMEMD